MFDFDMSGPRRADATFPAHFSGMIPMKKLIALFLLLVAPAHADIVTVTVTGVVDGDYRFTPTSGFDTSGTSAPAGSSLIGDPFTVQWVVIPMETMDTTQRLFLSATLTINSRTVQYDPTFYSYMFVDNFRRDLNVTQVPGAFAMNAFIYTDPGNFPVLSNVPFTYNFQVGDNKTYPFHVGGAFSWDRTTGYFDIETMTLENPRIPARSLRSPARSLVLACSACCSPRSACSAGGAARGLTTTSRT